MDKKTVYDVHNLWTIFTSKRKWFLLSAVLCLCLGIAYLYWGRPAYSVTGKIRIIDRRGNTNTINPNSFLQNQLPLGLGNSLGGSVSVETEKEILKSRLIARDAVNELGLNIEYRLWKWFRSKLIYKNSPLILSIDKATLNKMDENLPVLIQSIHLTVEKSHEGYAVSGWLKENNDKTYLPEMSYQTLPAVVKTPIGNLTLSENNGLSAKLKEKYADGYELDIIVNAPMTTARKLAKKMSVNPPSKKNSSVLLLEIKDESILRGIDFINAIVENYNRRTNDEKHRETAKNDQFVSERLAKIDMELGMTDDDWEDYMKRYQVTEHKADVVDVMENRNKFETQLITIGTQIMLLDYLRDYVNDPANLFELIPFNVINYSGDAATLITRHNNLVAERIQILKSVSMQSPQGQQATQLIEELHPVIKEAINRDRQSLLMKKEVAQKEYDRYLGRISNAPQQNRTMTEITRQRNIKQNVYLSLLQKREEYALELSKTVDKGIKADATLYNKKVKPLALFVLPLALLIGLIIPFIVFFVYRWLKGTIADANSLKNLTNLPVIGDVPLDGCGTEEAFLRIRSELLHQMKDGQKTLLVTSYDTGDGKTFCAIRLAESLGRTGKRVLLCDFDLRNPSIDKVLNLHGHEGFCNLLMGGDEITGKIRSVIITSGGNRRFDVLVCGDLHDEHPANVLAREEVRLMLDSLKQEYDFIVLDSSAIGKYSDVLIDGLEDITCYVCRPDKTPKTAFSELNHLAEEGRLLSPVIIVNHSDKV